MILGPNSPFPRQLQLVELFAAGIFQEVGVNFVADAGVGVWRRPNGPGSATRSWRVAGGGRVLPEAAVFEDLADGFALMGFDQGDSDMAARLRGCAPALAGDV